MKKSGRNKRSYGTTLCDECLRQFERRQSNQRFCSPKCKDDFHNKVKRLRLLEPKDENLQACICDAMDGIGHDGFSYGQAEDLITEINRYLVAKGEAR